MDKPFLDDSSKSEIDDSASLDQGVMRLAFAELVIAQIVALVLVSGLWYHGDRDAVERAFEGRVSTVTTHDGDLWIIYSLSSASFLAAISYAALNRILRGNYAVFVAALAPCGVAGLYAIAKIVLRASLLIDGEWLWSTPCVAVATCTYLGVRGWFVLDAKQQKDEDDEHLRQARTGEVVVALEGADDRERRRRKRRAALRKRAFSDEDEEGLREKRLADRQKGWAKRAGDKSSVLGRLLGTMMPDWWIISMGFVCLVVAAGAQVLVPHYTGSAVNAVAIEKNHEAFATAVLLLLGMGFLQAVFGGLRGGLLSWAIARFRRRVRDDMLRAVLRQELGYFESTLTGDIMSRLCVDTNSMGDQISLNLNVFLRSLVSFAGVLGFMFSINWQLTVVTFIVLPPTLVMAKVYGAFLHKVSKRSQRALADCNSTAEEAITNVATVRVFAGERVEIARYRGDLDEFVGYQIEFAVAYCFYVIFTTVLPVAVTCCILYVGGVSVYHGRMGGGALVSFLLYQQQLSASFQSLGDVFSGLFSATGAAEKVF